ncbi:hypothetical protein K3495_g3267 [Podosphaera aphanis]|nr:hypothetical protein K3495_g3267 [Podosphaera aphanis]
MLPATDEPSSPESDSVRSAMGFWKRLWLNNQGAILIVCAQVCASCMDAMARYLQQGEGGMHPFQVIFARMSMTFVVSSIYMWWLQVPNFPLGPASVRPWLLARACFGFCGLFCLYYSVHYLTLAESTIFRFVVPLMTAFACSILLHQPFTRGEFLAGIVALIGIIIIAHPDIIFKEILSPKDSPLSFAHPAATNPKEILAVTPKQRLVAILVATLGIIGASGAYTTIRIIGKRAHALLSVNYFAFLCTISSFSFLLLLPGMSFTTPHGVEWILLLSIGLLGFVLQFLLTKGLQLDSSSKATSMLYSQIVFALFMDWIVWGMLPDWWGVAGGFIVVASTLWSALTKVKPPVKHEVVDEERPLLREPTENTTKPSTSTSNPNTSS